MLGPDATFSKGDRVDRFEIEELIGQGGMGAIYRALDTRLQRTVALKVVRADRLASSAGELARQRFLREALAVSKVEHRNVVRVLDFGFAGDIPYLAMEFLRGQTLSELVKATAGFLPIAEVVDVVLEVCVAIRACHDAGIIHRDLKPSNIFLCDSDGHRQVKVLDFGVSKAAAAGELTTDGQILGTPQFLAPEQLDGKASPHTDQYAIGVVLYACLTKALPYQQHADISLLRAIDLGKFTPPSALRAELPPRLEAIILRAMRSAPGERFESVHALGRELWEFAGPVSRERWRSYYLDGPLAAPPKASAHAMPLVEAMARGIAGTGPSGASANKAPSAPESLSLAARWFEASVPPVTTSDPQVGSPRRRRGVVPSLIVAGVLAAGGAGWWIMRRSTEGMPGAVVMPAPAAPATPTSAAPPRPPGTSAAAATPALAATPTPAATPPVRADAVPTPAPGARPPAPAPAQAVARAGAAAKPAPLPADKHPRRNNQRPPTEHAARGNERSPDGVPIMP